MKNVLKAFGIITLVAVIGFSMVSCGDDGGGDEGGGNAVIGAKLELSGQVYTIATNETNYTVTFSEYKGNLTIKDNNGGTATITNGKLNYTIETPNNLKTLDTDDFSFEYDNVIISDPSAKWFSLYFYEPDYEYDYDYDSDTSHSLSKTNIAVNIGKTSGTVTIEDVRYVYVDKNVTISGKGKTQTITDTSTYKTNNFSLALKEGWNAIHTKRVSSATYPAGNPSSSTSSTNTVTISLNNPSFKWVLDFGFGEDEPMEENY
jgi:hypothetical protein